MKLFFERLKKLREIIIVVLLSAGIVGGVACIFTLFPFTQIASIAILYCILAICYALVPVGFIYWLFIEPFRKGRAK